MINPKRYKKIYKDDRVEKRKREQTLKNCKIYFTARPRFRRLVFN